MFIILIPWKLQSGLDIAMQYFGGSNFLCIIMIILFTTTMDVLYHYCKWVCIDLNLILYCIMTNLWKNQIQMQLYKYSRFLGNESVCSSFMQLLLSEFKMSKFLFQLCFFVLLNCGIKLPKIWRMNAGDSNFNTPSIFLVSNCFFCIKSSTLFHFWSGILGKINFGYTPEVQVNRLINEEGKMIEYII